MGDYRMQQRRPVMSGCAQNPAVSTGCDIAPRPRIGFLDGAGGEDALLLDQNRTGVIAALIGQKLEPFAAAQLGVHVHGLAGDLARRDLGEVSLIATDLLDYLPTAFEKL